MGLSIGYLGYLSAQFFSYIFASFLLLLWRFPLSLSLLSPTPGLAFLSQHCFRCLVFLLLFCWTFSVTICCTFFASILLQICCRYLLHIFVAICCTFLSLFVANFLSLFVAHFCIFHAPLSLFPSTNTCCRLAQPHSSAPHLLGSRFYISLSYITFGLR